jgi:hypothetical protein
MKKLAIVFVLWSGAALASEYPRVDEELASFDQHVSLLRQEFAKKPAAPLDKEWVKAKLQHMVEIDQYVRQPSDIPELRKFSDEERYEYSQRHSERFLAIDRQNTADLKELLKIYPWFTISEFGTEASQYAWLLVQHADLDAPFQRQVLAILEPLAAKGETNPKNYAYLYDRVASSFQNPAERKLQRYGTQGECSGPGTWDPLPVQDPDKLDERRAAVGLPPMAEYKKMFVDVCHESTAETMRRTIEAAKKKYGNANIDSAPQQAPPK